MKAVLTILTGLDTAQRLFRCGIGVAVLMVVCLDGAFSTTESNAESPAESIEIVATCIARLRVSDPRECDCKVDPTVNPGSGPTNPYSPTHNLLASPTNGHSLPNGLSAPLRC